MGQYEKLDEQGNPRGYHYRSRKLESGGSRFVADNPSFENLVTNPGQGTRGLKEYKVGVKEYDRPLPESGKKSAPKVETAEERMVREARQTEATEKGYKEATKPDRLGKAFKAGGKVSSASSRADGCAQRGKTKGRMV